MRTPIFMTDPAPAAIPVPAPVVAGLASLGWRSLAEYCQTTYAAAEKVAGSDPKLKPLLDQASAALDTAAKTAPTSNAPPSPECVASIAEALGNLAGIGGAVGQAGQPGPGPITARFVNSIYAKRRAETNGRHR